MVHLEAMCLARLSRKVESDLSTGRPSTRQLVPLVLVAGLWTLEVWILDVLDAEVMPSPSL